MGTGTGQNGMARRVWQRLWWLPVACWLRTLFLFLFDIVVFCVSHVGLIYFDFWPFNLRFIWPKLCANIFPVPRLADAWIKCAKWLSRGTGRSLLADYSMGVVESVHFAGVSIPFRILQIPADVQLSCQRLICCSPQIRRMSNHRSGCVWLEGNKMMKGTGLVTAF